MELKALFWPLIGSGFLADELLQYKISPGQNRLISTP